MFDASKLGRLGIIVLGKQDENLAQEIEIDVSAWLARWPDAAITLMHQRHGDAAPYPAVTSTQNGVLRWPITAADTACAGDGKAELRATVGEVIAKSMVFKTLVHASLDGGAETPPEAAQGWVDQVLDAAQRAEDAADRAENAGGGTQFETDETLSLKDGVLRVNTAGVVEQDNTLPITSAAVFTEIGNINTLLGTI